VADTTGNSKRSETSAKLDEVRLKKEELELIKLEDEVKKLEAHRAQFLENRKQTEETLAESKRKKLEQQELCNHRKGGMDLEGIAGNGSHAYHAIAKHQLGDGRVMVLCLRCQKIWMPGDEDYKEMLRAQTDNVMSTSAQFGGMRFMDVHQFQDGTSA